MPNPESHDPEKSISFEQWRHTAEKFDNERDRRYEERHISNEKAVNNAFAANEKAVTAAFSAAKEAVGAALAAAKEAVVKAEDAQRTYNASSLEVTRKMDDKYKEMLPRGEADVKFVRQDEKIEDVKKLIQPLTTSITLLAGKSLGAAPFWAIGASIVTALLVALILTIVKIGAV